MNEASSERKRTYGQGLLLAILLLSLLHNYLFVFQNIGLNYLLFYVPLAALILHLSLRRSDRLSPLRLSLVALGLVYASFVVVNASSVLVFFNVITSLALLVLVIISTLPGNLRKTTFTRLMIEYMLLPLYSLIALFQHRLYQRQKSKEYLLSPRLKAILRGIAITIPIALIFIALLASADKIFANLFSFNLPHIDISGELILRLFLLLFVGAILLAIAKHILFANRDGLMATELNALKPAPTEMTILLSALNGIFLVFILVQVVYLFGGRQVVLDNGLTFADYARRGFFELVFVAGLAHIVISITDRLLKGNNERHKIGKLLQLGLIAEVFVIIASALKRLKLYQDAFGFTTTRFYAYVIMFCIAAAFVALAWKIIVNKRAAWLTPRYCAIILIALFCLNMVVPDNFVAKQNIDRYLKTGKIDEYYISTLSADAADQQLRDVKMKIPSADSQSNFNLCEVLRGNAKQYSDETDWRSYNAARDHFNKQFIKQSCNK